MFFLLPELLKVRHVSYHCGVEGVARTGETNGAAEAPRAGAAGVPSGLEFGEEA